jgi:MraZ protein
MAELDGNGRFLIPKPMLRHAQIEKHAIVVGMGNRVEIWNPKLYEEYLIKDQSKFSELAQKYLAD